MDNKQTWIAEMWENLAKIREARGDEARAAQARLSAQTFRTRRPSWR